MSRSDDSGLGVIEHSAIVKAVERAATRLGRAATASRMVQSTHSIARAAKRNAGLTLLAAVATHVALVGVVVKPVSGYWLIIPAVVAAAGAVLAVLPRPGGRRGD